MKKKRLVQGILWTLVALWTGLVLYLTLQSGPDTAGTSERLAKWLLQVLAAFGIHVAFDPFHMVLRTAAHFVLFFVFGVLFESAMLASLQRIDFAKACVPALTAGTAISVIPEVMKLWIPGRHLQWDEVLLNVAGAFAGVLGIWLIRQIVLHVRLKAEQQP